MDRLHLMQVFVAVADEEGFAAGARRLHLSPPAVTRAVAMLEERLGVKLFDRTTRSVRTTEAGRRYLEDARRVLAAADAADEAAIGINSEPKGHLAITAPVLFGRLFVLSGIVEYLERYPGTEVSALFLDRIVNLIEEGLDVGVRIGELPDSSLQALRVGSVRRVLCASPDYLHRHGSPATPQALTLHTVIASSAGDNAIDWRFATEEGGRRGPGIRPRLTVTTNDAALEAARRGLGITRLLSYQIADQLVAGELEVLLADYEPRPWPVHIVHREGRYSAARVRTFIDLLAARLRADPTLNPPR